MKKYLWVKPGYDCGCEFVKLLNPIFTSRLVAKFLSKADINLNNNDINHRKYLMSVGHEFMTS